MSGMRYVDYECTNCGAKDRDKIFPEEAVKPAINCYKCHAGYQVEISRMLSQKIGMFPKSITEAA